MNHRFWFRVWLTPDGPHVTGTCETNLDRDELESFLLQQHDATSADVSYINWDGSRTSEPLDAGDCHWEED